MYAKLKENSNLDVLYNSGDLYQVDFDKDTVFYGENVHSDLFCSHVENLIDGDCTIYILWNLLDKIDSETVDFSRLVGD